MVEFIITMIVGYYFFEHIFPKIRRKFNKNVQEPKPISYMMLEYFTAHRKLLVFCVLLSFFGTLQIFAYVVGSIASAANCLHYINNDLPMLQHFGICGLLQSIF